MSNFLPWQAAYSELVFLSCYWPDFTREHLADALRQYAARERRFGGVHGAGRWRKAWPGAQCRERRRLSAADEQSAAAHHLVGRADRRGAGRHLSGRSGFPAAFGGDCRRDVLRMVRHVADRDQRGAISWSPRRCSAWCCSRSCSDTRRPAFSFFLRCPCLPALLDSRIGGQGLWAPAGLAYAGLSGLSLAYLRDSDQTGLTAILFLFAVVWATDICAYFVGRSLGGPKLAPAISPGKTQSGAIGGTVGGVLAGIALAAFAGLGNFPDARAGRLPAFGRLAGRRSFRILGQAASRREGFGQSHSRPWRRHGSRRRACRRGLCPIRHRLGCSAAPTSPRKLCLRSERKAACHGFAPIGITGIEATLAAPSALRRDV